MSFRFKIHKPVTPIPSEVYETVKVLHSDKGFRRVEYVEKSAHNKPIPSPSDYRLSLLLQAGVRLDSTSSIIDESINDNDLELLNSLNTQENETIQ